MLFREYIESLDSGFVVHFLVFTEKTWEKFEDVPVAKSKKLLASATEGGGAVCAADAVVSDTSQWTALGDIRGYVCVCV